MEMKIEVIYKENYASILNYVSMKVKDKLIAEDITADVFLKVCTKLKTFNPDYVSEKGNKTSFNTWLHTIANNCIIDKFRKDAKENVQNVGEFVNAETGKETFQFVSHEDSEANYNIENLELKKAIYAAIDKLKPAYRNIAILHFINELNYNEVVKATNIPLNTVKVMIFKVRERLQTELKSVRKALV